MIIDNYLVDNKDYTSFPNDLKCEAFSMNIRFICLSFEFINKLEKILKNYQISIDRILSADYVKSFMRQEKDSIFEISNVFGFLAIILAAVNIFGGFLVTQRMLQMYKKKKNK